MGTKDKATDATDPVETVEATEPLKRYKIKIPSSKLEESVVPLTLNGEHFDFERDKEYDVAENVYDILVGSGIKVITLE